MPKRKRHSQAAGAAIAGTPVKDFRQRYNDLEQARTALLERLDRRMKIVQTHPSAKRALKLLNTTFRSAKVAQRAAILQSAEWLITLIEMTPPTL
jgi:hypothetical protein